MEGKLWLAPGWPSPWEGSAAAAMCLLEFENVIKDHSSYTLNLISLLIYEACARKFCTIETKTEGLRSLKGEAGLTVLENNEGTAPDGVHSAMQSLLDAHIAVLMQREELYLRRGLGIPANTVAVADLVRYCTKQVLKYVFVELHELQLVNLPDWKRGHVLWREKCRLLPKGDQARSDIKRWIQLACRELSGPNIARRQAFINAAGPALLLDPWALAEIKRRPESETFPGMLMLPRHCNLPWIFRSCSSLLYGPHQGDWPKNVMKAMHRFELPALLQMSSATRDAPTPQLRHSVSASVLRFQGTGAQKGDSLVGNAEGFYQNDGFGEPENFIGMQSASPGPVLSGGVAANGGVRASAKGLLGSKATPGGPKQPPADPKKQYNPALGYYMPQKTADSQLPPPPPVLRKSSSRIRLPGLFTSSRDHSSSGSPHPWDTSGSLSGWETENSMGPESEWTPSETSGTKEIHC